MELRLKSMTEPHTSLIYHIHNCCRAFCKPFNYWVEGLFGDLHTDFKWSSDLKEALAEMCLLLGVKFTVPERFVPHRWLSAHDLAVSTIRLLDVLKVFYFSFLSKNDKKTYSAILDLFTPAKRSVLKLAAEFVKSKEN